MFRTSAATALAFGLLASSALAGSGGVSAPGPETAPPTARTAPSARPSVSNVFCQQSCLGLRSAISGSTIEAIGKGLTGATRFEFVRGKRTVSTQAVPVTDALAWARIPAGMRSGSYRVRIVSARGKRSRAARRALRIKAGQGSRFVSSESPKVVSSEATPRRWFAGSADGAAFQFVVRASSRTPIRVDIVKAAGGAVVRSLPVEAPSNSLTRVVWDGRDGAGAPVEEGRYTFVANLAGSATPARSGASARASQAPNADTITVLRHAFPIAGAHRFGEGGGRFGGGRGHQGQDVFARCGTPLRAARGGTVSFNQFHSRAGYYIVIDGDDTNVDIAYMHMRSRSPLGKGDKVATGQPIGEVGDTGRASGCHLHIELWRGPWQRGGTPYDPLPELRAWAAAG